MDVSKLIDDDVSSGTFRIHGSTVTSKEIMSLELDRIYATSWLYIGHDSESSGAGRLLSPDRAWTPAIHDPWQRWQDPYPDQLLLAPRSERLPGRRRRPRAFLRRELAVHPFRPPRCLCILYARTLK